MGCLSPHSHFGIIVCTCLKMACIVKRAGHGAKLTETWDSGTIVKHIGYFWLFSIDDLGVIWCTCVKMAISSKTAGRRAKVTELCPPETLFFWCDRYVFVHNFIRMYVLSPIWFLQCTWKTMGKKGVLGCFDAVWYLSGKMVPRFEKQEKCVQNIPLWYIIWNIGQERIWATFGNFW